MSKDTRDFYDHFCRFASPEGAVQLYAVAPEVFANRGMAVSPSVRTDKPNTIEEFISTNRSKHQFFNTCLMRKVAKGRGKSEDATKLVCLWADIDCKRNDDDNQHPAKVEFECWLNLESDLPSPTALVDSGNGFHVYWFLAQPIDLTDPIARLEAKSTLQGLDDTIKRWYTENRWAYERLGEFARVLRLPGSFNVKTATPKAVRIAKCRWDSKYSLSDFPKVAKNEVTSDFAETPSDLNAAILACRKVPTEWNSDGSSFLIRLLRQCVRFGTGENGAIQVVRLILSEHPSFPKTLTDQDIVLRYNDAKKQSKEGEAVEKPKAYKVDPANIAEQIADNRELFKGGLWYRWNDGRYVEQDRSTVRATVLNRIKARYSHISISTVSNVLEHLQAIQLKSADLKSPSWLELDHPWNANECLPFRDKIVHLPSFIKGLPCELANTPDYFTTNCLDFDWQSTDPGCPQWQKFLESIWSDADCQRLLKQWFGYCLARGRADLQKILFIQGPPRSGKGTIAEILGKLVGEPNTANPTLQSLAGDRGLAPLIGKQLATFGDVRFSGGKSEQAIVTERLLSISGQDAITIDRKYQEAITTRLHCRLMMLSNELPRLTDQSLALAKRFIVLPMTKSFFDCEDTALRAKLETELVGIMHWAIAGWVDLQQLGRLIVPQSSREAMKDLDDLSSPISVFVEQQCRLSPNESVTKAELYEAYKSWCFDSGIHHPESLPTFAKSIKAFCQGKIGEERTGAERLRKWTGIGLVRSERTTDFAEHDSEIVC